MMPRYRMFAAVNWVHNSKIDLGEVESEDTDEATDEAFVLASERLSCWVEEIPSEDDAS